LEKDLAEDRQERADLEARMRDLDPDAQIEVSRLKDYIAGVRDILDKGGLVAEPDGIWAYVFNEAGGLVDAEYFGSGPDVEAIAARVTRPPRTQLDTMVETDDAIEFEMAVDTWA
jgi:hypothetical protein